MKLQAKITNAVLHSIGDAQKFYEIFTPICDYVNIEDVIDCWGDFKDLKKPNNSIIVHDNKNKGGKICSRPLIHMVIHSNGEVSACCADWKFATVYGNASSENLVDIWHSERLRNFQLMHLEGRRYENEFCKVCTMWTDDNIDDIALKIAKNIKGE